MDRPHNLPAGYCAIGFTGKPVIDVRYLNYDNVQSLSRLQLRDILYALGRDKPSWNTVTLRAQVNAVVHVLHTQDLQEMLSVESKLGITLPREGVPFKPRSVPRNMITKKKAGVSKPQAEPSQAIERIN